MHELHTPTEIFWMLIGLVGGVARIFGNYLANPEKPTGKQFLIIVLMNCFISGFSGYMGAVFGSQVTDNDQWHVIFAGIFGYLGVVGLDWLSEKTKSMFRL